MDWQKIVSRIQADTGLSEAALAKIVGVTQPTIHRLKNGETKEPKYSIATKLLALLD